MKIRIQENTVRLRLTRSEVDRLRATGSFIQQTNFGKGSDIFTYAITLDKKVNEPKAEFKEGTVRIFVPEKEGMAWLESNRTGIENYEYSRQGDGLKLLIEKDFQCLHQRQNEDESDAFANPMAPNQ